jgi:hypothetical protein
MPARSPIGSVNDFVVRFANVNGSGSASANELFASSVLVLPRSTLVEERQTQWGLVMLMRRHANLDHDEFGVVAHDAAAPLRWSC